MTPPTRTPVSPSEELEAIRGILIGPELDELGALRKRLEDPLDAETVGRVLAEAITLRTQRGDELREALMPVMVDGLKVAIEREPQAVADAIYPIIGPAIRRSVAATLREFTASLRRSLDLAFTPRSLRWRWEAWRTGRSFSEIVLMHSLVYRVKEVFLIHGETGLAILHVASSETSARDPELVSSMLSAIQDFTRDSFGTGDSALERLEVGGLVVYIERGPHASVAAVVVGVADEQALLEQLQTSLEAIHDRYGERLRRFDGDATDFAGARPLLEDCLISRHDQSA